MASCSVQSHDNDAVCKMWMQNCRYLTKICIILKTIMIMDRLDIEILHIALVVYFKIL